MGEAKRRKQLDPNYGRGKSDNNALVIKLNCQDTIYDLDGLLPSETYYCDTFQISIAPSNKALVQLSRWDSRKIRNNNSKGASNVFCFLRKSIDYSGEYSEKFNRFIFEPIRQNIPTNPIEDYEIIDGCIVITLLGFSIDIRGFFITIDNDQINLIYTNDIPGMIAIDVNPKIALDLNQFIRSVNQDNFFQSSLKNKLERRQLSSFQYRMPTDLEEIKKTLNRWRYNSLLHPRLEAVTYRELYELVVRGKSIDDIDDYRILIDSSNQIYGIAKFSIKQPLTMIVPALNRPLPYIDYIVVAPQYMYRFKIGSELMEYLIAELGESIAIVSYPEVEPFLTKFGFKKVASNPNPKLDADFYLAENLVSSKKVIKVDAAIAMEEDSYQVKQVPVALEILSNNLDYKNILQKARYLFPQAKYYEIESDDVGYRLYDDGRYISSDGKINEEIKLREA